MLAERVVEWTQQWKDQGLQQGQLQEARAMVLEAIAARFGVVPEDIAVAVQSMEGREGLHTLLRQAVQCPSLDALRAVLHRS